MMYQNKKHPSQKIILALLASFMLVALNMTAVDASVESQSGNFNILAESTFDTGAEGWGIINDGTVPTHYATGGFPGGYLKSTDLMTGSYWYWSAPSKFLGNQSAAYGGSLSFYLFQSNTSVQSNQDDILFSGGGYELVYNTLSNPKASWTLYSIDLVETASGWTHNASGQVPTQAEMQAVLAGLQSIKIRGEYHIGADFGGIDSVYLKSATFTPTATLSPTVTATNTSTPTGTPTLTPTLTPTYTIVPISTQLPPKSNGSGNCWSSRTSWATHIIYYDIDSSIPPAWIHSIEAAAETWNSVTPSHLVFVRQIGSGNIISYEIPNPSTILAGSHPAFTGTITSGYTKLNSSPTIFWDTNNTPDSNNPNSNGSTTTYNVQNVMTHEFGHWLYLDDIDNPACTHVTMDYSVGFGELIKIDLDVADENATNWQYP